MRRLLQPIPQTVAPLAPRLNQNPILERLRQQYAPPPPPQAAPVRRKKQTISPALTRAVQTIQTKFRYNSKKANAVRNTSTQIQASTIREFLDKMRNYVGETIRLTIQFADGRLYDEVHTIDGRINRWFRANRQILGYGSDTDINEADKIIISRPSKLRPTTIIQAYRHGINHCVFHPIRTHFEGKLQTTKDEREKRRIKKLLTDLQTYEQTYPNGIPHSELNSFAQTLKIRIELENVLQSVIESETQTFGESNRNHKLFIFRNTKLNHLDHWTHTSDPIEVPNIQNYKNEFYIELSKHKIETPTGIYVQAKTEEEINFDKRYNAIKRLFTPIPSDSPVLDLFTNSVDAVRIIHETGTFKEIDAKRCYMNTHKNLYHKGFVTAFTHFAKIPDNHNYKTYQGFYVGYYTTYNRHLELAGFKPNTYYFRHSDLWETIESVSPIVLTHGYFGSNLIHNPFQQDDEEKLNEIRKYCLFVGKLGANYTKQTIKIPCTEEDASIIKSQYPNHDLTHFRDTLYYTYPIKSRTYLPFARQIKDKATALLIQESFKYSTEAIAGFNTDALLIKQSYDYIPSEIFQYKQDKYKEQINSEFGDITPPTLPEYNPNFLHSAYLLGQGGCGKTHTVLTDITLQNGLYVSPTHALNSDKYNAYNIRTTTIDKFLGLQRDGKRIKPFEDDNGFRPSFVLCDEITQYCPEHIEALQHITILKFLAGDINRSGKSYQCSYNGSIKLEPLPFVQFTTDYRAKDCITLQTHKLNLRKLMDETNDLNILEDYLFKHYPTIKLKDLQTVYQPNDRILSSTNSSVPVFAHLHDIQPLYQMKQRTSKHELKEIITENDYQDLPNKSLAEQRQCFTIHAFQGKTQSAGKLFIDMSCSYWDAAMYYTAISRCIQNDQIYLII
jgi:hypothetical protein